MPGNIGTDAMASQAECHLRHLPNSYDGEGIGPLDLDTPSKEAYEAEEEIPLVDHHDDFGVVVPRTHPRARQLPVWLRYPRNVFRALIPSFLKASDPNAVQKPLHPTAWLGKFCFKPPSSLKRTMLTRNPPHPQTVSAV